MVVAHRQPAKADARPLGEPTLSAGSTVAVAFSGGRDSLALLHTTCHAAQALGLQVVALHVHHGLLGEADGWLLRAQRLCARWARRGWPLRLRWARLSGQPAPGDSLEAWARQGRYQALGAMAREEGATLLLLAHHRRDQAETWLLQALRGGGPAGLSAMPLAVQRDGLVWARPWLRQPATAIDSYVRRHRLQPVQDPSNADPALARSRLRLQVWPMLSAAFADAEATLAAAASQAQLARAALDELAALDLAGCVDAQRRLLVAAWRQLSPARQANALRAWWRDVSGRGMAETLATRLLTELRPGASGQWPAGHGWRCVLYRGALRLDVQPAEPAAPAAAGAAGAAGNPLLLTLNLSAPGCWPLPGWGGAFEVRAVSQGGQPLQLLEAVTPRPRGGGEHFQARPDSLPRSLKKQFQAAAVPAADRAGPLLFTTDGRLLFVPGLGPDARCLAAAGEPQLGLHWRPDTLLSDSGKPAR